LSEWIGVSIALVSSCLGGSAAAITRYLVGNADPVTLAILRWGIGFACLLPTALLLGVRWPPRSDLPAVAALGLCFFGLFFVLYNIAIGYTTAARASLALATLPLHTMVVGALLGIEPLTRRKTIGVGVAVLGVIAALASGLSAAPPGAWRGELIMTGAVMCMAFYNVWSRPFIQRSSALGFLTVGMGAGAAALILLGSLTGSVAVLSGFGTPQWIAGIYLGIAGGALAFILWVMALERASPTRVANTMTVTRSRRDCLPPSWSASRSRPILCLAWSRYLPESGSRPPRPKGHSLASGIALSEVRQSLHEHHDSCHCNCHERGHDG
jgi:drug/metabolite transporter (DMT)-like permease